MRPQNRLFAVGLVFVLALGISGCATLQQFAALTKVEFSLDRLSNLRVAGVDLSAVRSFDDIRFTDATRLALAVTQGHLPLDFQLHVLAENPAGNATQARLMRMTWTLFLQERETLSGALEEEFLLPPGRAQDIPLTISLDLMEYFDGGAQELVEMVLSLTGQGGAPTEVSLKAIPVIDTPLGPISYPQPITILSKDVGR